MRPLSLVAACVLALPAFAQEPGKDAPGDPLPEGAVARLGTERLRNLDDDPAWLTPDGKRLLAVVNLRWVYLDPLTGRTLEHLECDSFCWGLNAVSADGRRAVSRNRKDFVVWELSSGKELFTLPNEGHPALPQFVLSADGKHLAHEVVPEDGKPKSGLRLPVYDVDAKKRVAELPIAQNKAGHIRLSADGSRAVTWGQHHEGKEDGFLDDPDEKGHKVQVWDVKKAKELCAVVGSGFGSVESVAISPAGDRLAVLGSDDVVTLFDAATGKELKALVPRVDVNELHYSPDGKTLAGFGRDGGQLWDADGRVIGACRAPADVRFKEVVSVSFREGGSALAVSRVEGAAVVWEVPSGKVLSPPGPMLRVTDVAFADREVLTADSSNVVKRWDRTGANTGVVTLPRSAAVIDTGFPLTVRVSGRDLTGTPSPLFVRDTSFDGVVGFALPTGEPRLRVKAGSNAWVAVTPDGATAVAACTTEFWNGKESVGKLTVLDLTSGTRTRTHKLPAEQVVAAAVTPDGKRAAVVQRAKGEKGEWDGKFTLRGYELATGKNTAAVEWEGGDTGSVVFLTPTPGGSSVLVGLPGRNALWEYDLATEKKDTRAIESDRPFTANPVFSADGKRLAVATEARDGGRVKVLSWPSGDELVAFTGHSLSVSCLAFSPDGKTLATGSLDTTVLLWDVSKEK